MVTIRRARNEIERTNIRRKMLKRKKQAED